MGNEPDGYVSLVRDSLQTLYSTVEIIGAGISGNKVTDLQQRLKRDVLSKNPDIVVIYIGINDVWHFYLGGAHSGTRKDIFKNTLEEIITSIQLSGAIVVLCTPSVIGEKTDGLNALDTMLNEYSDISRAVAASKNVALVDLRKEFIRYLKEHNPNNAEQGILTYDGVHLNEAGNRFVAEQMITALHTMQVLSVQ